MQPPGPQERRRARRQVTCVLYTALTALGASGASPAAAEAAEPPGIAPSPSATVTLRGRVTSREDHTPLPGAEVSVIAAGGDGQRLAVATDEDGAFALALPPGAHTLRVVADLHKPARVRNVRVLSGRVTTLSVALEPDADAIEDLAAVEYEPDRNSAAGQVALRRNAAGATDTVGAQDIARSPDRSAADAVKRVVGASVVDGRTIVIRGLGDRYTSSLVDGLPMPSTDPDRTAVPLDMFPSLVLSDLSIKKTYTPDLPGQFAGGILDIRMRRAPERFTFLASLGVGLNGETTFARRPSYAGGSLDWLGVDDGTRRLPAGLPRERITRLRPDGTVDPNLTDYGRALSSPIGLTETVSLPSGTGSLLVGDTRKLGGHSLGYIAALGYSRRFQRRTGELLRTYGLDPSRPGELVRLNDYRVDSGTDAVTISSYAGLEWRPSPAHTLTLSGLLSRSSEAEARRITGFNDEQQADVRDERQRFLQRQLMYGQLRGEHRIESLRRAELGWSLGYGRATSGEPDLRESVYVADAAQGLSFREGTQSGQHFFANQGETTRTLGLTYKQPIRDGERPVRLELGGLASLRGRSFEARRFRFLRARDARPEVFRRSPAELFTPDNVGTALELEEWTRPTDLYAARYDVVGGHLMADVALHERVRVVVGQRLERAVQSIDSFDPFAAESTERVTSRLERVDALPSANLTLKTSERTNLRLAVSRTVSRPQLRELAPFIFSDFFGAREILGNPDLDRARIVNLDARAELFPGDAQVLSASFFYKSFTAPIEPIILPTSRGVLSYANARGAVNAGVELEARRSLGFVHKSLSELSFLGNLTLVHSRVELSPSAGIQTSQSRALAGQSPYVVNLALDWEHPVTRTRARLLYNVYGARISQVGQNGLPDVFEQPRHLVDASVGQGVGEHVELKLTLENLMNSPVRFSQGESGAFLTSRYLTGTNAWLTASYKY
ncbi:MAG: TonB-dependent receptor [Myxococcales bacterium]|nr:TonB-dependent receptor [Myxococcales bacterium]